ncbi:MAG: response regulator [Saprospiraceae bacterium]|nr:response regulator [Saprospiraceae bacterium]
MVIKTIIVDDEEIWRELAQSYLTVNEEVKIVAQCTSAKEALKILTEKEVDMMLLDVQMQDISGISLAKSLKKPPHIVLMTSHPEFAVDGFDIEAVDFMVKPFTFERLMMAVERVKKRVVLEKEATNSEEVRFSERIISFLCAHRQLCQDFF